MSLKDTFKIIQSVADKYLIDKPYAVGGLPRDIIMGIPSVKTTDIDITTNSNDVLRLGILLAEELNVTFELSDDGHITVFSDEYDIDFSSNFISEDVVKYLDGKYEGLEEAFSRDFTINALHQDLVSGEIVDPTDQGFEDIKNKVIKTPVPAEITLMDDPRRAYRAINLAARYDFDIANDIKEFVLSNPDVFGAENIKDKYIALKISKALSENEERTLKLLKEMNLFKNVPLSGKFKEVLIERKMLVEYLSSSALDHKTAAPNSWQSYVTNGPPSETNDRQALADWWKQNANKMPGNWNQSYSSWTNWYMSKYRGEWGGRHKSPSQTLKVMKEEAGSEGIGGFLSGVGEGLYEGIKDRTRHLKQMLGLNAVIPASERIPKHVGDAEALYEGKVYVRPGVNITNVAPKVTAFIEELGNVAERLGAETPIITSGWRSVESQASIMFNNWKSNGGMNGGREYLIRIYNDDYANAMADIFEAFKDNKPEAVKRGIQVIKSRPVGSYHIANPGEALDLSVTSGIVKVIETIQQEGKFDIKHVDETNTAGPHHHVSIVSQNAVIANIRSRKEKLRKLANY